MARSFRVYNGPAEDMVNAYAARVNAGSGPGKMQFRSGSQPANNGSLTGTVIREWTFPDPGYGAASGNGTIVTAQLLGEPISDNTGPAYDITPTTGADQPGYCATLDSDNNVVSTGTAGIIVGQFDLVINSNVGTLNQEVRIVDGSNLTFPQQ